MAGAGGGKTQPRCCWWERLPSHMDVIPYPKVELQELRGLSCALRNAQLPTRQAVPLLMSHPVTLGLEEPLVGPP